MHGLEMTHHSGGSHIAAVFSVAEIVAVLYNDVMVIYPDDVKNDNRDRFILSKGHAGVAVYVVLAEKGFFDLSELDRYCDDGGRLSGHVSHKGVPGVEFSTGSLGHGLPVGTGMALAAKVDGKPYHTYVVCGDGECDEGSMWEAALFASHHQLSNLTLIIDHNKMQSMFTCEKTLNLGDLGQKWREFGWDVRETDGHDCNALREAIIKSSTGMPVCVIAHTVKGKGVSFMENNILWHYRDPQGEFYEKALIELEAIRP